MPAVPPGTRKRRSIQRVWALLGNLGGECRLPVGETASRRRGSFSVRQASNPIRLLPAEQARPDQHGREDEHTSCAAVPEIRDMGGAGPHCRVLSK